MNVQRYAMSKLFRRAMFSANVKRNTIGKAKRDAVHKKSP